MLKQAFSEFSVSEKEVLHKGYDRFQKILSQFNQMHAKPDNDDVNIKFLKALPPSWSQVALTLKTRGGPEYLSFDDLYNKLSIIEDVLHFFVAKNKPTQQLAYEDFEQAGQKINFNNKDYTRFDRRKARCYNCLQLGDFTRECNVKKVDEKARYSAFKISETEEAEQVYGLMAGFESDFTVPAALEENVRILSANLENTTNTLKYFKTLYDQTKIEKKEWEVKFVESLARSIPAASRNKPASIHVGKHILAGRINKPAPFPAGGTVTFGGGDGKIIGRGTIRTYKLNFENVYYVEELQNFNLFSVSQICDKKNKVLFTDDACLVLSKDFQLPDESQVVLRIPRRHDLYTFNLSDIQPEKHINCLLEKASLEESTKWHRRMAHFKTINKLAKHGLVEGLPLKLFTNEHNCVSCNKGKQHKASYKAISAVKTIFEPLQLLHMDLFGPTSIKSIDHKYYSLVVTDDFSRFCWAFIMGTKDETFYILKDFIALIKNQLNKKVKAIRCDNGTEFRNEKLIALCREKEIKRDYRNARTPQ
nr:putative ribonuclease H-like domain-containing protein [Tanacetum cinerariifolium]